MTVVRLAAPALKFLTGVLLLFVVACSSAQITNCEYEILRVEIDPSYWALAWVDMDCDSICDMGSLFSPDGELYAVMTCEQADDLWNEVEKILLGESI